MDGVKETVDAARPMPLRETVCGLPVALSVMLTDALRWPVAVGVKVTLMVQFAPALTLEPQVLVSAKSPGFVPAMLMLVIVSVPLPVFVSVTVLAILVVPTT